MIEFALKTPPKVPGALPFAISTVTTEAILVTYPVNVGATDVTIVAETIALLASPSWSGAGVTYEAIGAPVNGVQTTRARIPVNPEDRSRFVRLRVSKL